MALRPRSEAGNTARPSNPDAAYADLSLGRVVGGPLAIERAGGDPGTIAEATWGEEHFQPVAYQGFRVGPFRATGEVRAGETVAEATYRLWLQLNEAAMKIRDEQTRGYLAGLEKLQVKMNEPRR